jgi:hypothetical protein
MLIILEWMEQILKETSIKDGLQLILNLMKITLHLLLFINDINMLGMKVMIKVQSTPRRQEVL